MSMHVVLVTQNHQLLLLPSSERSTEQSIVEEGGLVEGVVIKRRENSVFLNLKGSKLVGCLHVTDTGDKRK